jgi:hypothetical protein
LNIGNIIDQLKTAVPALQGRVSGAADFAAGLESAVNMLLPAAYVLRLADDTTPNDLFPGLQQLVEERMAVVVEFDNTTGADADRRTGFAGVNQVDAMRANLWAGLLSWIPPDQVGRAARGFSYGGARLLDFDRARLFWEFDFTIETTLTDADGVQLSGDPLTQIQGTVDVGDGAEVIIFNIP